MCPKVISALPVHTASITNCGENSFSLAITVKTFRQENIEVFEFTKCKIECSLH